MNNCQEEGCNNIAIYRYKKPVRCKEHISRNYCCQQEGCDIKSSYGYLWYCQQEGCYEKANYGYEWSKPVQCKEHKREDMVYVTYKRCEKYDCKEQAIFGKERKYVTHCREHAEENMINLSAKLCQKEHCKERAIYGNTYKKPIFCIKHASEDMIYALYITCEKVNCNYKAEYGKKWGEPSYCNQHTSIKTMEYVSYERCREENGCINKAVYNNQTKKRNYCEKHTIIEKKDEKDEEKEHRNYFLNKDKWNDLNTENKLIINIKNFKEVSDSFNLYGTDNILIFSWHALERMNEREITKTELFYELHNTPNKITEFDIPIGVHVCISTNNYIIIITKVSEKKYMLVTVWKTYQLYEQYSQENIQIQCNEMIKQIVYTKELIGGTKDISKQLYKIIKEIHHLKKINKKTNKYDKYDKYNKNNKNIKNIKKSNINKKYLKEFLSKEDEFYLSDSN